LASTSPTLFPETSEVAEEREGRRVDSEEAWEPELGGCGIQLGRGITSPPPPGTADRERRGCGAGGTAGQQRLLQVPGASAATAPRWLLRWNLPGSHQRVRFFRNSDSTAASLLRKAGPTVQNCWSLRDLLLVP
ncbi:PREDICTED: protein CASC10, partial [Hipposideros armiger]|uniref:Protein CASC10 n=1 Tax=Hipposideros armiger TaxID=186990 RepID=A0A8B7T4P0_HIPAR